MPDRVRCLGHTVSTKLGVDHCEAYHYPTLTLPGVRDTVPRWQHLDSTLDDSRQPHDYQVEALEAWSAAGQRGSIVLPTGAGKTFVAVQAIHQTNRSTVIVAPTIACYTSGTLAWATRSTPRSACTTARRRSCCPSRYLPEARRYFSANYHEALKLLL